LHLGSLNLLLTLRIDYAGVAEEIGSKVTKNFEKGDRVAGFVHPKDGAFGEYIIAKGDIQVKIQTT